MTLFDLLDYFNNNPEDTRGYKRILVFGSCPV
jgi:hypothetical protein